jgi:HEAT repeat protein
MTGTPQDARVAHVLQALEDDRTPVRLGAALAAGSTPDPRLVDALLVRSATEPDFFVRDMLTWALTRHSGDLTLSGLLAETRSAHAQARSQALHTLSKLKDPRAWPAITRELLGDADDDVARSAWRAAVVLVPEDAEERNALAAVLATQLGRGPHDTQLSLSQALAALGEASSRALERAASGPDPRARVHAQATRQLMRAPDIAFRAALEEAKRITALTGAPAPLDGHHGGHEHDAHR